ncbi:hypothetical protein COCNU_01G007330 [Cocos nucifera]|uniref:Uncharacterized protein n=1 Tax=Cocos nucifera TaxID=13894 RepID=A0A8K0MUM5_COCNU|nr:hypothetical protein COCNU_01G007330 [Cocos nucifera]
MNNNSCHHPFHGFNNNVNHMQRFREEPQLRPGTLSQPPIQATPGAYASSGLAQLLMQYQAAHHAYRPSYHLEGRGRRPAHHEAFARSGLGNLSPAPRQAGITQPLQDSRPRIFEGQGFLSSQVTAGHLRAAHQMEIQRRQLEENMALASLLRNLSSNCAVADPAPPAPSGASGSDGQQKPGLVDYMGVQGVRVALGDVKAMVGSLRGTLFDVRAEANSAMNLDLTLGCSDVIDLTLSL